MIKTNKENREYWAIYTTKEAAKLLRVSIPTFIKHRNLLGITPRKARMTKGYFYSHDDLTSIVELIYPTKDVYSFSLDESMKALKKQAI